MGGPVGDPWNWAYPQHWKVWPQTFIGLLICSQILQNWMNHYMIILYTDTSQFNIEQKSIFINL